MLIPNALPLGAAVVAVILLAVSPSRANVVNVCNRSSEPVSLAFGYEDRDLGMVSEGWWKLDVGECAKIVPTDQRDHRYVFLYARGDNGGNWSGADDEEAGAFCVRKNNFKLINRAFEREGRLACERRSANTIRFRRIDTASVPAFTYDLK